MSDISVLSDIKNLFDSSGFAAILAGAVTALAGVAVEHIRSKQLVKVERVKLFEKDRVEALKRLIVYAQKLSRTRDPEEHPDMKYYSSIYEEYGETIELDAAFHSAEIISDLKKITEYYYSWEYAHLGDSYESVLDDVDKHLPNILASLTESAQKELHSLKLR